MCVIEKTPIIRVRISAGKPDSFPDEDRLADCLSRAMSLIIGTLGIVKEPERTEIGVAVTNDRGIRRLNLEHRGKDEPTDVISFPILNPDEIKMATTPDDPPLMLGDIVLSIETIEHQAKEREMKIVDRFTECFLHGVLHLLGWNHETDKDRSLMEELEDKLFPDVLQEINEGFVSD